ncbi:aspartoacylase [Aliikangiella maris]|uniref:Aspartoacylase n=2 Tax=Aliikangiella maris TaxID=3162458 RepID=A0ABV2BSC1_9GAMM
MQQEDKVNSIVLVGGTHGNELTGIHLVNHWQKQKKQQAYSDLNIEYFIANPEAIAANKRYLETDLNRCFKLQDLNDITLTSFEQKLAKKINQQLGPKGQSRVDFIIDLHTSTANMQTNIVLVKVDEFHLKLAAYLKTRLNGVVVTSESAIMPDHHFLSSISPKTLLIEIGPIAQGTLDPQIMQKTELALSATLDFTLKWNNNDVPASTEHLKVLQYFSRLYFPTDERGEITATVHPDLIAQDYQVIEQGTPIFQTFDGEDILYDGDAAVISFVNEAAYYDQKIAMCLSRPVFYDLQSAQKVAPLCQ